MTTANPPDGRAYAARTLRSGWCEMAEIGHRPVVVLPRDAVSPDAGEHSSPCTTAIRGLVSEVGFEPGKDHVPRRCGVNGDSVESVSVAILGGRLGGLADTRMRPPCAAQTDAVPVAPHRMLRRTVAMPPTDFA